jgi:hypothetical protein
MKKTTVSKHAKIESVPAISKTNCCIGEGLFTENSLKKGEPFTIESPQA